jgi:hypothetical protein
MRRQTAAGPTLRLWHQSIGMFIAPSVLFFSLTGIAQVLDLHESHAGYEAPALLVQAGMIHKHQVLPGAAGRPHKGGRTKPPAGYTVPQALLKGYFVLTGAGLAVSTGLGVFMALQNRLRRRSGLLLLATGALIPVLLLMA